MKSKRIIVAILMIIINGFMSSCEKTEAQVLTATLDTTKEDGPNTDIAFKAIISIPGMQLEESIESCEILNWETQDLLGNNFYCGHAIRFTGQRIELMVCREYDGDIGQIQGIIDGHPFGVHNDVINICSGAQGVSFDLFIIAL